LSDDPTISGGNVTKRRMVFQSALIFDGASEILRAREHVFVEGGVISEISARPPGSEDEVIDCGGRVLMPGLIDAHVHVYGAGLNIVRVVQ
jgi:imidazolonepropionase-like amidohydrolase